MKINSKIAWGGVSYPVIYQDLDNFDQIKTFNQIYGICFVDNKIVICFNKSLGFWVLPGGTPEDNESPDQALKREIMEEAGLKLISYKPIGYQQVYGDNKIRIQLRAVCKCEKANEHADPCGDISEVKLINIDEINAYIDWGDIGTHIFQKAKKIYGSL